MFPTNNQLDQMMQFSPSSLNVLFLQGLKIVLLIIAGLYTIFAFMTTRQIGIMDNTLKTPLIHTIRLIGYLHLFAAIMLMVFVLQYSP